MEAKLVIAAAMENQSRVGHMLTSEDGQRLMDILEKEYYENDLVGADALDTYRKLGRRDVVVYLRGLLQTAKEK